MAERLFQLGCHEISLGDTIGAGTPLRVQAMLDGVLAKVPVNRLAVHFHDTYGQALANVLAALEKGIGVVDSSVSGLGGCPFAQDALVGNIPTEVVLEALEERGVRLPIKKELESVMAMNGDITRKFSG